MKRARTRDAARARRAVWVALLAGLASSGCGGPSPPLAATTAARTEVRPGAGAVSPAEHAPVPLYGEEWFDDGGFSFAKEFAAPVANVESLDAFRAALLGRGARGRALLLKRLDTRDRSDPDWPAHAYRLHLMIGALHLFDGEFVEAERRLLMARDADPGLAPDERANLEALLGVAALRRGEVENCVACRSEASCIFPLAREAVHKKPDGSREAMARFKAYLERRPEDLGVRWLLNVAAMTLGEYPEAVPPSLLIPLEPFRSAIDIGRFPNVAPRLGLDARGPAMAGGCLVDDFDGDGRLDLFTSTSDPAKGASLYLNKGDGTFEDRSDRAGLANQTGALNASQADYDNDGDLDVLMLRGGWDAARRLSLLRNRGDGTFEDATLSAGMGEPIGSQVGVWADYDLDGDVDVYVAGEYQATRPDPRNQSRLYRNNGDGTFTDAALLAGVTNGRYAKGASWGDYDDDGDPDLYVSNLDQANRLYRNDGDGRFTDLAGPLGLTEPLKSFACWFWDYDDDGRLDLWVNGYGGMLTEIVRSHLGQPTTGERPRLYRNLGPAGFKDVTVESGLDRVLIPMGSNYGDLDNDGHLDMYLATGKPAYSYLIPNAMFKNVDGKRFVDVTTSTGTGHLQKGHGVAFADWDGDGDQDVFLESGGATPGDQAHNVVFENPGHRRHWLAIRLVGTKSNRSAIGAKVRADVRGPDGGLRSLHRVVSSGGSFGGNPLAIHLGLSDSDRVEALEIRWPTPGVRDLINDIPADRSIVVTEGRDGWRPAPTRPIGVPGPATAARAR